MLEHRQMRQHFRVTTFIARRELHDVVEHQHATVARGVEDPDVLESGRIPGEVSPETCLSSRRLLRGIRHAGEVGGRLSRAAIQQPSCVWRDRIGLKDHVVQCHNSAAIELLARHR
jgi:hypothetical protein